MWGVEQQTAFEKLVDLLTNTPVLSLPDFERPFEVTCDASVIGVGATLS